KKFGKSKFSSEEDIRAIVGENNTDLKISVMADVGRCDYKTDIINRADSPIDLIRIATYLNTIPEAVDMIEDAHAKGYETSCNIMAISNAQEGDLTVALDLLGQTPVDVFYIVDSYGSLYPEQIARIADVYMNAAAKYGKKVGIHAHNNQQLAFANTIEAVGDGADWLDGTYAGMGRGAGNCAMELLLGFLRNPKYKVYPAIQFVDEYIGKLKEEGVVWGYDLQYLMTGLLNQHPRTAIAFTKAGRKDYAEFYREVVAQD
ncbi:MAG: aldolase catalytic domain-containing protein, partial [Lachnospiraceae bacterium]|nr:aldolase catalytic domain-containing protein [Lachnospiraceae bacterium]